MAMIEMMMMIGVGVDEMFAMKLFHALQLLAQIQVCVQVVAIERGGNGGGRRKILVEIVE